MRCKLLNTNREFYPRNFNNCIFDEHAFSHVVRPRRTHCPPTSATFLITSDKGGKMRLPTPTFVCLLARLLKNTCMDLDEMLCVDRCRGMNELINFWARSDYSPDAGTGLLSPISFQRCYAEFYVGKVRCIRIDRCSDARFYNGFIHWGSEPSKHLCRR